MSKKTLALIIGLLAVTVILLIVALSPSRMMNKPGQITKVPTPTPDMAFSTLSLSPNNVVLSASGSGQVDVVLSTNANKVSGVQLELSYDPKVLSNVSIGRGPFFSNGITFVTNPVNPQTGRIKYLLGNSFSTNTKSIQGTGVVAQIFFSRNPSAAAGGTTALTFLDATKVTQLGVNTSVLKSKSSATITLGTGSAQPISPISKPSTSSAVTR